MIDNLEARWQDPLPHATVHFDWGRERPAMKARPRLARKQSSVSHHSNTQARRWARPLVLTSYHGRHAHGR
eukprot:3210964-Pleurochrysis_carterae.AAC.2